MKNHIFLIINLILIKSSFSQDSKIFDDSYFINSLTDLFSNNVDSVNIYTKGDSLINEPILLYVFSIQNNEESVVVEKHSKVLLFSSGIYMTSIQVFYLNKNFLIDSIHVIGVQEGVFINEPSLSKKIIDYEEGKIKSITEIRNNFSDTTITSFFYFENLVYKVNIKSSKNNKGRNKTTNEVIYIEYYRKGEILKKR